MQNEQPVVGQHFLANRTLNDDQQTPKDKRVEWTIQKILRSSIAQSTTDGTVDKNDIDEIIRLQKLVPGPDNQDLVGATPLSDDFETLATDVPQELVNSSINWVKHGYYTSFGNWWSA